MTGSLPATDVVGEAALGGLVGAPRRDLLGSGLGDLDRGRGHGTFTAFWLWTGVTSFLLRGRSDPEGPAQ